MTKTVTIEHVNKVFKVWNRHDRSILSYFDVWSRWPDPARQGRTYEVDLIPDILPALHENDAASETTTFERFSFRYIAAHGMRAARIMCGDITVWES